jgi:hypothetical protein
MAIGDRDEIRQLEAYQGDLLMYVTREEIGTYFYHGATRIQYRIVAVRVVNNLGRTVTLRVHVDSMNLDITRNIDPPGLTHELTSAQSDALLGGYSIEVIG